MFFDSPVYFVFLTVVVLVYWQLNRVQQNVFLVCASYFFYGWWDWRFLSLVMISTAVDFYLAHAIDSSNDSRRRFRIMMVSIALNIGFLAYFKYMNFFIDQFVDLLSTMGVQSVNRFVIEILLPPGISFYTFQAIAYIVDVHDRKIKPASSLLDYALFISLFPHLVAGPIQRPDHLLPQCERERTVEPDRIQHGLMLIAWGLFRKCVIADNCALVADAAFSGRMGEPSLWILLLGAYAFSWQIYGDFSGYSQMARGSALLMGFDFMINFRQPFLATSVQDLWQRWHISLGNWLRDYVFLRLRGSRKSGALANRNLMITMLVCGLWHGANWTYIVWGAIQGVAMVIGRMSFMRVDARARAKAKAKPGASREWVRRWLLRAAVFHIFALSGVFFRSPSIEHAFAMLGGATSLALAPGLATAFIYIGIFAALMLAIDLMNERDDTEYPFEKAPFPRLAATVAGVLAAVALATGNNANAFIYFQF